MRIIFGTTDARESFHRLDRLLSRSELMVDRSEFVANTEKQWNKYRGLELDKAVHFEQKSSQKWSALWMSVFVRSIRSNDLTNAISEYIFSLDLKFMPGNS